MTSNREEIIDQAECEASEPKVEKTHSNEECRQAEEESPTPFAELTAEELRLALTESEAQNCALTREGEKARVRTAAAESEILRMAADFQNARKRLDRMTQELVANAKEGMVTKLLAVLDDLDLAEANAPTDLNSAHDTWFKGVTQIRQKILAVFHEEDVGTINTEGVFDPSQHEAVQMIPSEEYESGHIVETLRKGYKRGDKVIRPAMVRIAE